MRDVGHHFGGLWASFSCYFGCLGGLRLPRATGGVLDGSWAILGHLLAPRHLLAVFGRLLDSSWAVLEASWSFLGRLLGRLGQHVGSFLGRLGGSDFRAKIEPRAPKMVPGEAPEGVSENVSKKGRFPGAL